MAQVRLPPVGNMLTPSVIRSSMTSNSPGASIMVCHASVKNGSLMSLFLFGLQCACVVPPDASDSPSSSTGLATRRRKTSHFLHSAMMEGRSVHELTLMITSPTSMGFCELVIELFHSLVALVVGSTKKTRSLCVSTSCLTAIPMGCPVRRSSSASKQMWSASSKTSSSSGSIMLATQWAPFGTCSSFSWTGSSAGHSLTVSKSSFKMVDPEMSSSPNVKLHSRTTISSRA
mmetsp:Transcript_8014/g.22104  ORF Transcript_8014/g.22104 Transcript_8014/m.22104 type:complete len:231 (+) Transcript_8014:97-789(+)